MKEQCVQGYILHACLNASCNNSEEICKIAIFVLPKLATFTHVGKYDRADDRPKLAMLAANVGYRYWTDDRSRLG